eukprot:m.292314 g.292314  ORF g.292314 m.292314 type:complete len:446 (+) comp19998_c0_seq1:313-1650(+)
MAESYDYSKNVSVPVSNSMMEALGQHEHANQHQMTSNSWSTAFSANHATNAGSTTTGSADSAPATIPKSSAASAVTESGPSSASDAPSTSVEVLRSVMASSGVPSGITSTNAGRSLGKINADATKVYTAAKKSAEKTIVLSPAYRAAIVTEIYRSAGKSLQELATMTAMLAQHTGSGTGASNTAKWTDDETQSLKRAIDTFGDEIKKIAEVVRTRTASEISTRIRLDRQRERKKKQAAAAATKAAKASAAGSAHGSRDTSPHQTPHLQGTPAQGAGRSVHVPASAASNMVPAGARAMQHHVPSSVAMMPPRTHDTHAYNGAISYLAGQHGPPPGFYARPAHAQHSMHPASASQLRTTPYSPQQLLSARSHAHMQGHPTVHQQQQYIRQQQEFARRQHEQQLGMQHSPHNSLEAILGGGGGYTSHGGAHGMESDVGETSRANYGAD